MLRITVKNIVVSFFVIMSISQSGGREWLVFPVAGQSLMCLIHKKKVVNFTERWYNTHQRTPLSKRLDTSLYQKISLYTKNTDCNIRIKKETENLQDVVDKVYRKIVKDLIFSHRRQKIYFEIQDKLDMKLQDLFFQLSELVPERDVSVSEINRYFRF